MTLDEARAIARNTDGLRASYAQQVEAAAVIAKSSTDLKDLVDCLRMGGLAAEIAAMGLYSRTGRHVGADVHDFIMDPDDWSDYLALRNEPPRTFHQTNRWGVAA